MAKLNTKDELRKARTAGATSPIKSKSKVGRTAQGGVGFERKWRGELFLLAVTNFVKEDTFYESAHARDSRYVALVQKAAEKDPAWLAGLLRWLRAEANMRSAAIVGAAEYARARKGMTDPEAPTIRSVVSSVLQRGEEPGELLGYWMSKYGRSIPTAVKRGVGDAVIRLGSEYSYVKYDSNSRALSYADVLNLVHPGDRKSSSQTVKGFQHELFEYATSRPYRDVEPGEKLGMLRSRAVVAAVPVAERRAYLRAHPAEVLAGLGTWEALAGWLQGPMDKEAWEAAIPHMGAMALIRNLRNFDEAGVSDEAAAPVIAKLMNAEEIKKSRQLPMRFLSAYRHAPSLRWGYPLEIALGHSLLNVPALKGRTQIYVDTSTSMKDRLSGKSELKRWDAAVLFALALASRCESAEVISYSANQMYWNDPRGRKSRIWEARPGESVLASIERWGREGYFLEGGTETSLAVTHHYAGQDRVVLLTDEQNGSGYQVGEDLPDSTFGFTANLAGYEMGHAPSGKGNHHVMGGLTDQMFKLIPVLESTGTGTWPWEQ